MNRRGRVQAYLSIAALVGLLLAPPHSALGVVGLLGVVRLGFAAGRRGIPRALGRRPRRDRHPAPAVALGRDRHGQAVTLSDRQLAAHALLVGAAGAGKSTTMMTVLADHVRRGRPVVAIDMKGSPQFARQLAGAAAHAGRRLQIWTPDGPGHWNPLAHGNATALKDMLISTERFSEPHYQRAAERYLQTALTVLHATAPGRPATLEDVVALMEPGRLAARLREAPPALAERVGDYLAGLTRDQESAVRGLGTRLALLSESTAGPYLASGPGGEPPIDLRAALQGRDVVLMSLNSSVYGKLAAQLGALAIQSLTSAAGYRLQDGDAPPATVAVDEFSALGADNVLALLARGREAGVSVLVATQELSDLERAGRGFRDQVMGIVGVTVAHRQDVHTSATMISQMAGTEWVWEESQTVSGLIVRPGAVRGTRRPVERSVIHPNEIKLLGVGDAILLTKLPTAGLARLRVTPPSLGKPPDAVGRPPEPDGAGRPPEPDGAGRPPEDRGRGRGGTDTPRARPTLKRPRSPSPGRREPPDQAAPGVTR